MSRKLVLSLALGTLLSCAAAQERPPVEPPPPPPPGKREPPPPPPPPPPGVRPPRPRGEHEPAPPPGRGGIRAPGDFLKKVERMVDERLGKVRKDLAGALLEKARAVQEEAARLAREGRKDLAERLRTKARILAEEARDLPVPVEFLKARLEIPALREASEKLRRKAEEWLREGWEKKARDLNSKADGLEKLVREQARRVRKAMEEFARKLDELRGAGEEMDRKGDFRRAEKFRTEAEILEHILSLGAPPSPPPGGDLGAVEERVHRLFKLADEAERLGEPEEAARIREKAEALRRELERERERRAAERERAGERPPGPGEKEGALEKEIRQLRGEIERLREEVRRLKKDRDGGRREEPPGPPRLL